MSKTVIIPVRIDTVHGETSELEVRLFKNIDEYPEHPDKSMWVAVPIIDGKIAHDDIDYGYRSLKELLTTYKNEKIIGLKENRKDAKLEESREIAEDALGVLLAGEDAVISFIEGEIGLEDGAIKKAYKTLRTAKKDRAKTQGMDKDEIFFSLSVEDILVQAKNMRIPRKKLTPEIIKKIREEAHDNLSQNDMVDDGIQYAITNVLHETEG